MLEDMKGCKYFSKLDLKDSYHQFLIADGDRPKTAFSWNGKQFMFRACPFGFKHFTSVFQRVMMQVLEGVNFANAYVDDVVIYSKDYDSHVAHTQEVIGRLSKANLTLNFEKCIFGQKSLNVLGFTLDSTGIRANEDKIKAIQD